MLYSQMFNIFKKPPPHSPPSLPKWLSEIYSLHSIILDQLNWLTYSDSIWVLLYQWLCPPNSRFLVR